MNDANAFWGIGGSTRKRTPRKKTETSVSPATVEPTAAVLVPSQSDPATRFFYDGRGFFLEYGQTYVPLSVVESVRRHLKGMGCYGEKDPFGLRPDDHALNRIQTRQLVSYAGPLAGFARGLHEMNGGKRVLVTESAKLPVPAPGKWETLRQVFAGLFIDQNGDETQWRILCGWIKTGFESLQAGQYRPGQALAMAGPRGCGKSLMIEILRAIFGGRSAGAHDWLSGRTNFNLACAGAELLVVDDKAGSSDPRARATLNANLKTGLFSGEVTIEGKHKNSFDCRPWWRLVFALNDEPENLLVLPPINDDNFDKITLLRCHRFPLPMPAHTLKEKAAFMRALLDEIPAFLHWLTHWEIPADLREERCGVTYYRHPELVSGLQALAPESQLLQYIQEAAAAGRLDLPAKLTAAEIQRILTTPEASNCHAARRLLDWPAACGAYLARLARAQPERVRKAGKRQGNEQWELLSAAD